MAPLRDGGDDIGVGERRDIALALQRLLVVVHRARHIDSEDEFEIDRRIGRAGKRQRRRPENRRKDKSERARPHGNASRHRLRRPE
jgi:hypothetical protein